MSADAKTVASQVAFFCPRCKATLQIHAQTAGAWVRCPKCGKASPAPDPTLRRATERTKPVEGATILGPEPEFSPTVAVPADFEPRHAEIVQEDEPLPAPANPMRVAAGAGFCVTAILGIFAALEHYDVGIIAFGAMGVVCLISLLRIPADS